jgi:hypothetical protein
MSVTSDFILTQHKHYLGVGEKTIRDSNLLDSLADDQGVYHRRNFDYCELYSGDKFDIFKGLVNGRCPVTLPGDFIYIPEPYRITDVCQVTSGYEIRVQYKYCAITRPDLAIFTIESDQEYSLTPRDTWISNLDPTDDLFIRLKLVCIEVNSEGNYSWNIQVVHESKLFHLDDVAW